VGAAGQAGGGRQSRPTSDDLAEIKRLEKESAELHEANEILKAATISARGNSTLTTADLPGSSRSGRPEGVRSNRSARCYVSSTCWPRTLSLRQKQNQQLRPHIG
jgi:hypothetical protein